MLQSRRSFLVHVLSIDDAVVVENLLTRERARVDSLDHVGDRIRSWLDQRQETDSARLAAEPGAPEAGTS
jgi:hypothetical protein